MRMLAFFLNGYSEYGKYVGGDDLRFLQVSSRLRDLGLQIIALEYKSFHSERYGQLGYFPVRIQQRFSGNTFLKCLRLTILGSILCSRNKCDIVYVNNIHPWREGYWSGLLVPYVVSLLCRKPLTILFHGFDARDTRKARFKLRAIKKAICMAVSKAIADDARRNFQVKEIFVVGDGVDFRAFGDVADEGIKRYDAIFVGRVEKDKGIFDLLNAWGTIVTKIPSAKLLIAGYLHDNVTRERTRKIISALNLERNIFFSGQVSHREIASFLKASKIFVLPSYAEGFGLAIAEAMAAGLPCIISDLPATKEVFSSAALFVQPKNVDALTEAILFLLSNPAKCKELEEKGKQLARQFSWEKVAAREFEVLKRACA